MNIPFLTDENLEDLNINTQEVVAAIEQAIIGSEEGTVWSAPKAVMLPDDGRYMMAALAASDKPQVLAVKTVVMNQRNVEKGIPQINGLVTLLNSETGFPAAVMDGNWITAVRTAGLSAVAAKYLANPQSSVGAFLGTGVQAKSHLQAFKDLFPLEHIKIFGRGRPNIDKLGEMAEGLGLTWEVSETAQEAMKDADLITTSISYSKSLKPFIDADWTKPGSFSAVADLAVPWIRESFEKFDTIIIDDLLQEASLPEKLVNIEWVDGDLSQLVLDKCPRRSGDQQRNAFIFRGHALGDLALSGLAYEKHLTQSG